MINVVFKKMITYKRKVKCFPSVWVADFSTKQEFDRCWSEEQSFFSIAEVIDDFIIHTRRPFRIKAYCVACQNDTEMLITWHYCGQDPDGSVHPAWTETAVCPQCGLNSRMRAVVDCLLYKVNLIESAKIYLAERISPSYDVIKGFFNNTIGSEYLGADCVPGESKHLHLWGFPVQHENLNELSFKDSSFDVVVTQDVFEHIPDFTGAFREIFRVLNHNGKLIFTVPFFAGFERTRIRATTGIDGAVNHLFPPEIHGNPMSETGSLCFQNFGWDLLDILREVGFVNSAAPMYWGPWQGHLGCPFFVFRVSKI